MIRAQPERSEEGGEAGLSVVNNCLAAELFLREPVWPSGKAVGWEVEGPRFDTESTLLSLQKLWFMDTVL